MIKLRKRGKKAPEIMLSPMIDMMFLLLIFFIVSAMYMSELKTIPVKLPVASETIFPVVPVAQRVCLLRIPQYAIQNCTISSFLAS